MLGAVPPGTIAFVAGLPLPAGRIKANITQLDNTLFSDLFVVIGYTYGGSNGLFNVPDLRGEFIRDWDDGRGADSGRVFGSTQGDAIRHITGSIINALTETSAYGSGAFAISNNCSQGNWSGGAINGDGIFISALLE